MLSDKYKLDTSELAQWTVIQNKLYQAYALLAEVRDLTDDLENKQGVPHGPGTYTREAQRRIGSAQESVSFYLKEGN